MLKLKVHDMSEEDKKLPEEEEKPEEAPEEKKEEVSEDDKPKKKKSKKKEPEEDVLTEGDFILLEMTGKVKDTDEVFDTTDEEMAREEGIYNENQVYGPKLVVIGQGFILKGLDDKLPGVKLGEESEIEVPPEEAFGERRQEYIQTVPFRLLRSKGVNPSVGARLEVDGRMATIRSVGGGRVQLDYNHPQAGRSIVYTIKPTERYVKDDEKVRALIGRYFLGIELDKFKLKKTKKKVKIEVPEEIFFGENIQMAKRGVAMDIQRFFEEINQVEYTETIKRPKPQ
jgi:FKBP-type peptidyl-prolyl cis-trans isomerase 2